MRVVATSTGFRVGPDGFTRSAGGSDADNATAALEELLGGDVDHVHGEAALDALEDALADI